MTLTFAIAILTTTFLSSTTTSSPSLFQIDAQQYYSPLYSGTTYILLPDIHRSGGPACLHSLNQQLNLLGMNSQMFNLIPQYTTKHSKSILNNNHNQIFHTTTEQINEAKPKILRHLLSNLTPHDFIVLPTHWIGSNYYTEHEMTQLSNTGARTLVYLLGVAYPNDDLIPSNNDHGLVVGFNVGDITYVFKATLWAM